MRSSDSILVTDNAGKRFRGLVAVDDVSFNVGRASITALIGPNGAGKTTLFNLISGFLPSDTGRITFDGQILNGLAPHIRSKKGLVRTFQIPRVFSRLTVLENMLVADYAQPGEKLFGCYLYNRAMRDREIEARDKAFELLQLLNISHIADDYAGSMSGGQRKLIELGRVLMTDPTMILLDEPMAGVNPTLGQRLLDRVEMLREERGLTFLFVEHDMDVVMRMSDRVLVLDEGRLIADGPPDSIKSNERVIDAYLGRQRKNRGAKSES